MKRDFKRPNGTIKRTQLTTAPRKGVSSVGTPYTKGNTILHMSSSRATGETFVLTMDDVEEIRTRYMFGKVSKWHSPKKWSEQLFKKWLKDNPKYVAQFKDGRYESK